MKILVTGGTGYIGSHTVVELLAAGHQAVIADNLVNSSRPVLDRIKTITGEAVPFHEVDLADRAAARTVFDGHAFDGVIHFAGLKAVGESVAEPLRYYRNNLDSLINVAELALETGVKRLIFSSSATVYDPDQAMPLKETSKLGPTSPYGQTKLMGEQILRDAAVSSDTLQTTVLRYFNPVGAHESGLIGDDPRGAPNNLMPFIAQVATGQRDQLQVFGDDYDTPDGTGVRDYLHVVDLARAHVKALEAAAAPGETHTYNLGTGHGTSVLEIVRAFEQASGRKIPYEVTSPRPGDVAVTYADPTLAEHELGWRAEKSVEDMCKDAWHQANC